MKLRIFIFLAIFLAPMVLSALECSVCHREIRGKYCTVNNIVFCSENCYETTLPQCSRCGKRCMTCYKTRDGKRFCSKKCLQTNLPGCTICRTPLDVVVTIKNSLGNQAVFCKKCSRTEPCYYCMLPAGKNSSLADGRHICRPCRAQAVTNRHEVQQLFNTIRAELAREHGYDRKHRIRLMIVDHRELMQAAKDLPVSDGRRLGLMRYHEKREQVRYSNGRTSERVLSTECRIYVLHTMPRDVLCQTIAHELTHDHLRHRVGEVQDIVLEEGFCELIASLYNERHGRAYLNRAKEISRSPVYGEGYRRMRKIYQKNGSISATMKHVR